MTKRLVQEYVFTILSAATTSSKDVNVEGGCFGTVIVPTGSALIGKTLQFMAVSPNGNFTATDLLTTPITLVAGANPLSADQIRECGAVGTCRLKVNSSPGANSTLVLLWKN